MRRLVKIDEFLREIDLPDELRELKNNIDLILSKEVGDYATE